MSYASAVDIRREVARRARPPERISVSNAAHRYARLRMPGGGTEAWNPELTPYMSEPMDQLTSRRYRAVILIGPARTGKTGGLLGAIAYIVKCDPADALVVHMTQQKAGKFSKKELRRLLRDSPDLRKETSPRAQDDNTFDKFFRAGNALYIGYPAASQLSADTLKYILFTDYDRKPQSVDGEGTPFLLGLKRTQTYLSRGMAYVETSPGFEIIDPKWTPQSLHEAPPTIGALALYNLGTRSRIYYQCPHCGEWFMEPTTIHGIQFSHTRDLFGATIVDNYGPVGLICIQCGAVIGEEYKGKLPQHWVPEGCTVENGQVTGEPRETSYASYWMNGPSAAYQSWDEIVRSYLMAERVYDTTGDEEPLRNFTNLDWGGAYLSRTRQAQRDGNALMDRRESYPRGVVPECVRFLLAAIDIQGGNDRRFVVQVIGYGIGLESWLIDRFSLRYLDEEKTHRLDMSTHVEHWDVLIDQVIHRTYPLDDDSDRHLPIHLTACDSGGEDGVTDRAYDFYRSLRRKSLVNRFILVKGATTRAAPKLEERFPDNTKRKDRKAEARGDVPVWFLNTNQIKDIIGNNIAREEPGPGYMHWPDWLKAWFFDELTAENRNDAGTWEKIGPRNETFDLYVYAYAALLKLGINRMDWANPRPWAMPWDDNTEILFGKNGDGEPGPLPTSTKGRRVRFRMR